MRRGRHAAGDSSFARSAGVNAGRGAALLAVAVIVGIFLLNKVDDSNSTVLAGSATTTTTTKRSSSSSTTTTQPPHRAQEVKVLTLNGTTIKGAAGKVAQSLATQQFNMLSATDATATTKQTTKFSAVYFTPGYEPDARVIAHFLALPATSVAPYPTTNAPVADTRTANVVVLVGPDLANTATPASSTTTSTTKKP